MSGIAVLQQAYELAATIEAKSDNMAGFYTFSFFFLK
jgi:hypothetical protein